jgi:hypothetical protein
MIDDCRIQELFQSAINNQQSSIKEKGGTLGRLSIIL